MSYLPDIYQRFEQAFPEVHAAHQELAGTCYQAGPLDARSARLVKLGIAIGAQAEGAVRSMRAEPCPRMCGPRSFDTSACSP
jgi:4-carboxymuconolactone decarboxylase